MSSKSTEFVTNLHMLCGNPETYQKIIEIAQCATSKIQLDQSSIQNIALIFDRFLPQTSIQGNSGMSSFANPMGTSFGPPAIGGYQMSAPSFNPGAIPGQVKTGGGKSGNIYSETDFRNMINSGKQVCCKIWGPTSAKKGGFCCGEIKNYDHNKPADQQLCNTHNRSGKSKAPAMSSSGIANAFTNFNQSFAQPLGMQQGMINSTSTPQGFGSIPPNVMQNNQTGMNNYSGVNGVPNQTMQQDNMGVFSNFGQTQFQNTTNVGIPTQQNPYGVQSIQIPQFEKVNQQNNHMKNQSLPSFDILKQTNKDPFVIPSQQGVSLVPPNNQTPNGLNSNQMMNSNNYFSNPDEMNQQKLQTQGQQSQGQFMTPNQQQSQGQFMIPNQQFTSNIGQMDQKTQIPSFNPLMVNQNSGKLTTNEETVLKVPSIPSISLSLNSQNQNSQGSYTLPNQNISSISEQFNNMSVNSSNQQNAPQIDIKNNYRYYTRKLDNDEYLFNTDPSAMGLVFEKTMNEIFCVGVIKVPVAEKSDPLPPDFKNMVGYQFNMDQENWLQRNNIQKRDLHSNTNSEGVSEEFQGSD